MSVPCCMSNVHGQRCWCRQRGAALVNQDIADRDRRKAAHEFAMAALDFEETATPEQLRRITKEMQHG